MDQPHEYTVPVCRAKIQYAKDADSSAKLSLEDRMSIQQVTGTFLYYARNVDSTILIALSAIASDQAAPTEHTMRKNTPVCRLRAYASRRHSNIQQ